MYTCGLVVHVHKYSETCLKTTWEIGTTWELRTVTSVPRHIQYIEIELGNKTTSEFRTAFHSPLGVPNSQVPLYNDMSAQVHIIHGRVPTYMYMYDRLFCLNLCHVHTGTGI